MTAVGVARARRRHMENHGNDSVHLAVALTKDILVSYVDDLLAALVSRGYNVSLLRRCEGGIDFSNAANHESSTRISAVRKDLRFAGTKRILGDLLNHSTLTWKEGTRMDTVVLSFNGNKPCYDSTNQLIVNLSYGFSTSECKDVLTCLLKCFHLYPDSIFNRARLERIAPQILSADTSHEVNIFLGYNSDEATTTWTIPSPDPWLERLFPCWKCKGYSEYYNFMHSRASHDGSRGETTFYGLLGLFVHRQFPCCQSCYRDLTTSCILKPCTLKRPHPFERIPWHSSRTQQQWQDAGKRRRKEIEDSDPARIMLQLNNPPLWIADKPAGCWQMVQPNKIHSHAKYQIWVFLSYDCPPPGTPNRLDLELSQFRNHSLSKEFNLSTLRGDKYRHFGSRVAIIFMVGKKVKAPYERVTKETFERSAARLEDLEREHNEHACRDSASE